MTLDEKLLARASRVEHRPDGDYVVLPVGALTGEEFAELIMRDVKKLQEGRKAGEVL